MNFRQLGWGEFAAKTFKADCGICLDNHVCLEEIQLRRFVNCFLCLESISPA